MKQHALNSKCAVEVARLVSDGKADLHVDPVLYTACQLDLKRLCYEIQPGEGKQFQCLTNALADGHEVSKDCAERLKERVQLQKFAQEVSHFTPIHSHTLLFTPIHSHSLPFPSIHSHSLLFTPIHSHTLPFTPIPFYSLPYTPIHFHSLPFTPIHFHSLPFPSIPSHTLPFTPIHSHTLPFTSKSERAPFCSLFTNVSLAVDKSTGRFRGTGGIDRGVAVAKLLLGRIRRRCVGRAGRGHMLWPCHEAYPEGTQKSIGLCFHMFFSKDIFFPCF